MQIVILDNTEQFITYLDTEKAEIEETHEMCGAKIINLTYYLEPEDDFRKLFMIGNKVWVSGGDNLTNCLYVINTQTSYDVDEHMISLEAEEVLVELNYVPPANQYEITTTNGFTVNTRGDVTVNRNSLEYWFGRYYDIGIVQDCISASMSKIVVTGSMNLMSLLRYIETETGNVFVTRYEKDCNNNYIHRYLDFLNPEKQNKDWSFVYTYTFPVTNTEPEPDTDTTGLTDYDETDDITFDDEELTVPDNLTYPTLNPSDCIIELTDQLGDIITDGEHTCQWNASSLGLTGEEDVVKFHIQHIYNTTNDEYTLTIQINTETFNLNSISGVSITSQNQLDDDTYYTYVNGTPQYITTTGQLIPDHTILRIYDNNTGRTFYEHELDPILGDIHTEVLDLNYNVENIDYEIDETETYNACAPILTPSTEEYTRTQIETITRRWLNLSVTKGQTIPMILQRTTYSESTHTSTTSNYWQRCLNNTSNDGYDYWTGTAYWQAPFTKKAGEMYITDDAPNNSTYNEIRGKYQSRNEASPKIANIETSEEHVYTIYNHVAMKLKETRNRTIKVETDIANLIDHAYNNYNVHDLVYVHVPGEDSLIAANVKRTVKNMHEINRNTVELDNFSNNTKVVSVGTYLLGKNVSYTYPKTGKLTVTLYDETDTPLKGALVSIALYKVNDNIETYRKTYTRKTNTEGVASLKITYTPGKYKAYINYGGTNIYESCSEELSISVGGKVTKTTTVKTTSTKKTTNKTETKKTTTTTTTTAKKNSTNKTYTPLQSIPSSVKAKAVSVSKGKTGLAGAKLIANWVGHNIKYKRYANFHNSPATVLKKKRGNCCDTTRLMLYMMDAAGVTQNCNLYYVHAHRKGEGHCLARVSYKGKSVYCDPSTDYYDAYGYICRGFKVTNKTWSKYPAQPFY